LSSLYLMRHGQAGLRHRYDTLSDLGHAQARRLGEYLAAQNISFSALYSGTLSRQQETACEVAGAFQRAGLAVPEIQIDQNWNEFDLDMVYKAIAPRLGAEDPEFQTEHEKLLRQLDDDNSPVHRAWTQCDTLVVRAWVEGRYEVPGESWEAFRERVCGALGTLKRFPSGDTIAVFSSATPIAIWIGMALGLNARHTLRLAGVTYNAALTTMRVREDDLALFSFNGTPHLPEPHLKTYR
jgi:broad specificity phosphatase PhoE